MDGQHRAYGAEKVNPQAKNCNHLSDDDKVALPVTIIPGLKVAEQVFHFTMMNITPVRVKAGHARSNASWSLTRGEFNTYEPRLAKFTNTDDARWNELMDTDPASPFKGRIWYDYLLTADDNFLKESIANSVQKEWKKLESKDQNTKNLIPGANQWNNDIAGFKEEAFFAFWNKIADKFIDHGWDEKKSNLWWKVSLLELQKFIRRKMNEQITLWTRSQSHPFDDVDSLKEFTEHILEDFPSDFFSLPWNYVPDDTSKGRNELAEAMEAQYGRKKVNRKHRLFKGARRTDAG